MLSVSNVVVSVLSPNIIKELTILIAGDEVFVNVKLPGIHNIVSLGTKDGIIGVG
jgi:hypothetical protein